MTAVAEQTGAWLAEFTKQTGGRTVAAGAARRPLSQRFAELGFPTTHNEEWRFTNVAPIARTTFTAGRKGVGSDSPGRPARVRQRPSVCAETLPEGLEAGDLGRRSPAVDRTHLAYASSNTVVRSTPR